MVDDRNILELFFSLLVNFDLGYTGNHDLKIILSIFKAMKFPYVRYDIQRYM